MQNKLLSDGEARLMSIIWEKEPINSGELCIECLSRYGWKKSTVYTVLKKLVIKQVIKNEDSIVSSLVSMEQVGKNESERVLAGIFGGDMPNFLTTFLNGKKLSEKEAEQLKKLIDSHTNK